MRATALANAGPAAATDAAYTIIPMHVPTEAVGVSFEYKIDGAADEDFMAMGIGEENNYSMEARYVEDGQWSGTLPRGENAAAEALTVSSRQ